MFDTMHEECGVFGACFIDHAAWPVYYGLHSLQHRGQEAGGMVVMDPKTGSMECVKGPGLVMDVFSAKTVQDLPGSMAIGHVRYATAGGQEFENIQPLCAQGALGPIAIAHNGQLVNDKILRRQLESQGCIFQGTSDTEVILHLLMVQKGDLLERAKKMAALLEGAFCILILTPERVLAIRDCHGLHPLSYARSQDGWLISSETCAFEVMGIYESRDVHPGEIVEFYRGLARSHAYTEEPSQHVCAMEYIYFARPDSCLDGCNVHNFRKTCGQLLAAASRDLEADLVIGVPDSSLSAAIGYAQESGLPLESGFVKNRFVARSFIQPTQAQREQAVKMKLTPITDVVKGKRVVMVDDSIVRGTTSQRIVRLLKQAGASEVHVRIAAPPLISPCFYGVDMASKKELIACRMNLEETARFIEADSLAYLSLPDLKKAAKSVSLCTACFDGCYCTSLYSYQNQLET